MTKETSAGDTIFHRIARKEIPADIVYEDELLVAFRDISPVASSHILIVPRKSIATINDLTDDDALLIGRMVLTARNIAKQEGISSDGYRVVINCGENGTQTVPQLHLHLIGGRRLGWPPG